MSDYVLTEAAEADLRGIIRYTRKQWGDAQVRRYVARLKQGIVHLATCRGSYTDMNGLHPGLLMAHCEHHYVFCLPREEAPALVVAILHERMDLIARVKERLAAGPILSIT
ncbi:MAG: type II toxin-antitoxin system RelE/ParE family toxin [Alcaligenaceae bacterium]|nr:type II toxin-antitoxin system RelE/ParE family toxin [Alcaligenaceae bacterium]